MGRRGHSDHQPRQARAALQRQLGRGQSAHSGERRTVRPERSGAAEDLDRAREPWRASTSNQRCSSIATDSRCAACFRAEAFSADASGHPEHHSRFGPRIRGGQRHAPVRGDSTPRSTPASSWTAAHGAATKGTSRLPPRRSIPSAPARFRHELSEAHTARPWCSTAAASAARCGQDPSDPQLPGAGCSAARCRSASRLPQLRRGR